MTIVCPSGENERSKNPSVSVVAMCRPVRTSHKWSLLLCLCLLALARAASVRPSGENSTLEGTCSSGFLTAASISAWSVAVCLPVRTSHKPILFRRMLKASVFPSGENAKPKLSSFRGIRLIRENSLLSWATAGASGTTKHNRTEVKITDVSVKTVENFIRQPLIALQKRTVYLSHKTV